MDTIQYKKYKKFSVAFKPCRDAEQIEIAEIYYDSAVYPSFLLINANLGITPPSVIWTLNGTYLAGSIFAKATRVRLSHYLGHPSVKYGPGARRVYLKINEKLIDRIANVGTLHGKENRNQKIRKEQIADFADFLIELL